MSELITKRLRIEPLRAAHAPMVIESLQASSIYTYLPDDPPTLEDQQRRYDFLGKVTGPDGVGLWLDWVVLCRRFCDCGSGLESCEPSI